MNQIDQNFKAVVLLRIGRLLADYDRGSNGLDGQGNNSLLSGESWVKLA